MSVVILPLALLVWKLAYGPPPPPRADDLPRPGADIAEWLPPDDRDTGRG